MQTKVVQIIDNMKKPANQLNVVNLNSAYSKRLEWINKRLKRGDKKHIARRLGVSPVWVSYVLGGRGVSEPVLLAAEDYIKQNKR